MIHESENNIKCAHCDYEHEDWWEFYLSEDDPETVTCHSCNKDFEVTKQVSYSFDSNKVPCEKCELGDEYLYHTITQETCDRWNRENFIGENNHAPYKSYRRDCENCDEYETRSEPNAS